MSGNAPEPWAPGHIDRVLMVVGLIAFLGLLASYVALSLAHDDTAAAGILRVALTLAGVTTVGGGVMARVRAAERTLGGKVDDQGQQLTKIGEQTNGVLDTRIQAGASRAIRMAFEDYGIEPSPGSTSYDPTIHGHGQAKP